jgi:hypothetical protein
MELSHRLGDTDPGPWGAGLAEGGIDSLATGVWVTLWMRARTALGSEP